MFYLQVQLTDKLKIINSEDLRQFSYLYVNNIRKDRTQFTVKILPTQEKKEKKTEQSMRILFDFIP